MRLYIVTSAPTLFYQQGNHNSCIYHPWYYHCIIWAMNMRQSISSGVIKNFIWESRIKVGCTTAMMLLWDNTNKKTEKESIIILRNGLHLCHMIYFGISLLIQLCVCYQTRGNGTIIVFKFTVNEYLIPILKWRFHSHRIS